MYRKSLALHSLWLTAGLLTTSAGTPSAPYVIDNDPGSIEHVDGSVSERVILTQEAVKRLRVETTPVARAGKGLTVPDTAIFVDPEGAWWVYTNPEPGVYVRHEIAIKGEHDGRVLLTAGPRAGTDVVTVGVAELYGIEAEVGH